jgi:hypothetical protein
MAYEVDCPHDNVTVSMKLLNQGSQVGQKNVNVPNTAGVVTFPFATLPAFNVFTSIASNANGDSVPSDPTTFVAGVPAKPGTIVVRLV